MYRRDIIWYKVEQGTNYTIKYMEKDNRVEYKKVTETFKVLLKYFKGN